jgi:hypothetical protein
MKAENETRSQQNDSGVTCPSSYAGNDLLTLGWQVAMDPTCVDMGRQGRPIKMYEFRALTAWADQAPEDELLQYQHTRGFSDADFDTWKRLHNRGRTGVADSQGQAESSEHNDEGAATE